MKSEFTFLIFGYLFFYCSKWGERLETSTFTIISFLKISASTLYRIEYQLF